MINSITNSRLVCPPITPKAPIALEKSPLKPAISADTVSGTIPILAERGPINVHQILALKPLNTRDINPITKQFYKEDDQIQISLQNGKLQALLKSDGESTVLSAIKGLPETLKEKIQAGDLGAASAFFESATLRIEKDQETVSVNRPLKAGGNSPSGPARSIDDDEDTMTPNQRELWNYIVNAARRLGRKAAVEAANQILGTMVDDEEVAQALELIGAGDLAIKVTGRAVEWAYRNRRGAGKVVGMLALKNLMVLVRRGALGV